MSSCNLKEIPEYVKKFIALTGVKNTSEEKNKTTQDILDGYFDDEIKGEINKYKKADLLTRVALQRNRAKQLLEFPKSNEKKKKEPKGKPKRKSRKSAKPKDDLGDDFDIE